MMNKPVKHLRAIASTLLTLTIILSLLIVVQFSASAAVAAWNGNSVAYHVGDLVSYNNNTYQCITAHTSNPTWNPVDAPSLWKLSSGTTPTNTPAAATSTPKPGSTSTPKPAPTNTPKPASTNTPAATGCNYPNWVGGGSVNYVAGNIVKYTANGNYYKASHDNPGYDPTVSTWYWDPYTCSGGGGGGSATATSTSGGTGFSAIVSSNQFNSMFPSRNQFYTYQGLVDAINQSYPAFAATGSTLVRQQEAAAFLANVDQETGALQYVDEICKGGGSNCDQSWYCDSSKSYGCPSPWSNSSNSGYWGRGPIQISWNYNYKAAGDSFGVDLLNHPDMVDTNATIAWKTALWYWMTQNGSASDNSHNTMVNSRGFGQTIKAINGGIECAPYQPGGQQEMSNRVTYYRNFLSTLGASANGTDSGC